MRNELDSYPATITNSAFRVIAVTALCVGLLAAVAPAASASVRDRAPQTQVDRIVDRVPQPEIERLRLACAPELIGGERGILCRWSEAKNPAVRAYQLYKITNGGPRQLVATVTPDGRKGFFDTDVSAPTEVIYGVVARNRSGRVVGQSAPVYLSIG